MRQPPPQPSIAPKETLMDKDQSDNQITPRLNKSKRNGIIEAIRRRGLEPKEFNLGEDENEAWVKHKLSNAHFTIGGNSSKYSVSYAAGDSPAWRIEKYSWDGVMTSFDTWLYQLKNDLETPDLWAELQGEAELFGAASDTVDDNTPFTQEEKKGIAEQLRKLGEQAQNTYSLSGIQVKELNMKLDYLIKASDRIGRIDWHNALAGAIIGFVLTAALPPETARAMFLMFVQVAKTILLRSI